MRNTCITIPNWIVHVTCIFNWCLPRQFLIQYPSNDPCCGTSSYNAAFLSLKLSKTIIFALFCIYMWLFDDSFDHASSSNFTVIDEYFSSGWWKLHLRSFKDLNNQQNVDFAIYIYIVILYGSKTDLKRAGPGSDANPGTCSPSIPFLRL